MSDELAPNEKRCSKCKEVKDRGEFEKNIRQSDGLQTYCRSCRESINLRRRIPKSEQKYKGWIKGRKRKYTEDLSFIQIVESHISKENGHWIWSGHLSGKLPTFCYRDDEGKIDNFNVRKFLFSSYKKVELPMGVRVLPTCKIKRCVNPEHTYIFKRVGYQKMPRPRDIWRNSSKVQSFIKLIEEQPNLLMYINPTTKRLLPYLKSDKNDAEMARELGLSRTRIGQIFRRLDLNISVLLKRFTKQQSDIAS
jgi:hypothetical protein